MVYSMDIEEVLMVSMLKKWTDIFVDDIGQTYYKWLLFLKSDIVVTVPEGRCCCSVADVQHCY